MVYVNSHLGFCIENKKLSIKACDEVVNDMGVKFRYVFAADDAFVLKLNTMKPQPGQKLTIVRLIFIYRLSRAKKVIENAFGIFSSRFRIFRRPMIANVYEVVKVTKACVACSTYFFDEKQQHYSNSNKRDPVVYVETGGASGERRGDWRGEENSLHFSQLITPSQIIIQGM